MSSRSPKGKKKRSRGGKKRRSARRSARPGAIRRRFVMVLAALTIPVGLMVSVRRTAEGTRLAEQLADLRRETMLLEETLVDEVVRVESLTSRERIARIVEERGFRQATDDEVVIVGGVNLNTDSGTR
ncbi:MAG TPA: hypothetical protein VLA33_01485 [Gemmatimonadota bacterium]|nr:hypothetical protein [Gemmatimonadota bacterium]